MVWLANLAYVLYFVAYAVRDMLWLRLLTVAAAGLTLPYFFFQDNGPQWTPFLWALLFAGINVYQIVDLILERAPIGLPPAEAALHKRVFRLLTARQFRRLAGVGQWRNAEPRDLLVERGSHPHQLSVMLSGEAAVEVNGRKVAQLDPGEFIAELAYITGEVASADVRASQSCRYLAWQTDALREYLENHPEIAAAFEGILGADVALKLRERTWEAGEHAV